MVEKIGVVGLAVMGQNLVLNMADKGFEVVVYNRTSSRTDEFMKGEAKEKDITPTYSMEELVENLDTPRVVLLMVKSGKPVDMVIGQLVPLLEKGDTIIDGGNSYFKDTERRSEELAAKGINYLGAGISGGEEGARHGPSIMPGGQEESYSHVEEIFRAIAAKAPGTDNEPCVTYIGPRGAGHFVKMVHNGIEYAIMQAIAETYHIMLEGIGMTYKEMHGVFREWSESERLGGFLTEITAELLGHVDQQTGKPFLEIVKDTAGSKGTGKWTSQTAYDLGVPVQNISAALLARIISSYKEDREGTGSLEYVARRFGGDRKEFLEHLESALYSAVVISYAQGFHLMKAASEEFGYNLDMAGIARIWRGGCIIRSRLLEPIRKSYDKNPGLKNLMLAFAGDLNKATISLREVVAQAARLGIAAPVLSQSLAYFDSYRKARLPTAAMIQGQRDFFGAHTYQRSDREGIFHTDWPGDRKEEKLK